MAELIRFGVSLEKDLLKKFDDIITSENYANRSEAFRDLIREKMVKKEWMGRKEVAGTVTIVYDHHKRDLLNTLVDIQHDHHGIIVANQHIHLDHHNCLEIIVVRGKPREIEELAHKLRSTRGVKYGQLSMATTGKELQ